MLLSNGISLTSPTGGLGPEQIVNHDFTGTLETGDDYGEWEDDVAGAGGMSISGNTFVITDDPGGSTAYRVTQKIDISDIPDNTNFLFSWEQSYSQIPVGTVVYMFLGTGRSGSDYNDIVSTSLLYPATGPKIYSTIVSPGTADDLYVSPSVAGSRKTAKYGFISLKPFL